MNLTKKMKAVATALSITVASFAVGAEDLIKNGNFADGTNSWSIPGDGKWKNFKTEIVDIGDGFKSIKFKIEKKEEMKPWALNMRQFIAKPVKKGTPLVLSFKIKGTGIEKIFCAVEENKAPYIQSIKSDIKIITDWQTIKLEGVAADDYEAGAWKIAFNLAYGTGEIELSDIKLETK